MAPEPDKNGNWPKVAEDGSVYPYHEIYHELYARGVRAPRSYTVNAKKNDPSVAASSFTVRSSSYYNRDDGDQLIQVNGDSSRYILKSTGCAPADHKLEAHAPKSDAPGHWVSEHILELQAWARFLEAAISGRYLKPNGAGTTAITQAPYAIVYPNMIKPSFSGWTGTASPAEEELAWFGSVSHSNTMVVCESALNAVKSRVWLPSPPSHRDISPSQVMNNRTLLTATAARAQPPRSSASSNQ